MKQSTQHQSKWLEIQTKLMINVYLCLFRSAQNKKTKPFRDNAGKTGIVVLHSFFRISIRPMFFANNQDVFPYRKRSKTNKRPTTSMLWNQSTTKKAKKKMPQQFLHRSKSVAFNNRTTSRRLARRTKYSRADDMFVPILLFYRAIV